MKNRTLLLLSVAFLALAVIACICIPTPTPPEPPTERPTLPPTAAPTAAPTVEPTPEGPPVGPSLGDTRIRPADGMVMVFVPGGTFQMGSAEGDPTANDDEFPQHAVTLDGFWMDQTEVMNAQYELCVEDDVCWPSGHAGVEDYRGSDYPVVTVNWHNAAEFCAWAGARLPTEAEWEYAARGPEGHIYPWGDEAPTGELCNFDSNEGGPIPPGSYPAGASWCGALDMAGNVYEWVADWYAEDYYESSPSQNPTGPEVGEFVVLRGGSWGTDQAKVRASDRSYRIPPDHIYDGVGFRCVSSQE